MSNRDYVGLLDDKTEKEKLESAILIVRDYVDEAIQVYLEEVRKEEKTPEEILAEEKRKVGETERDIFSELGTRKLGDILPELKNKYEIVVGFLGKKIAVSYRVIPSYMRVDFDSISFANVNMPSYAFANLDWDNTTIGGNTITAGTINTTQLNVGGITANTYIAPIEDATRQLDLHIEDTVYRNVVVTEPQVTTFTDDQRQRIVDAINESATSIRIGGTSYNGTGVVNMNAGGWFRADNES